MSLKIAYTSIFDIIDLPSYNGGMHSFIINNLEKYLGKVDIIAPLNSIEENLYYTLKRGMYGRIFRKRYFPRRAPGVLDYFAQQIENRVRGKGYDLIFSADGTELSHVDLDIPMVFFTDAVFDAMVDFYPGFSNLCRETLVDGHNQEQALLDRAKQAFFTNQWAANSAKKYFKVEAEKIKVVPRGANLSIIPPREISYARKTGSQCNLLFVGKNWERKGGPIALEVVRTLNKVGLKSKLFVCSEPRYSNIIMDNVELVGLLNRNNEQEYIKMNELFTTAHYLLLPTRAECMAITFCESAAYGLPVVTTNVGGVTTAVEHNQSGIVLSKEAKAEEYAEEIFKNFNDADSYSALCLGARKKFENLLNWDTSMQTIASCILELLDNI